jgi:o-succinylbenzoate synthase
VRVTARLCEVVVALGRPAVEIALDDGEGHVGLGEAAPLAGFSRDDLDASRAALLAVAARLAAVDVDDRREAPAVVARALEPLGDALDVAPSARFAVECALLDLVARRRGLPLHVAIGGPRPYRRVETNALLAADRPASELVALAEAAVRRGARAIKVKLRASDDEGFARELDALRALRAALPDVELRLDPNARFTLADAPRRLASLAPLAPRYVEQPVPPGHLTRLGAVAVPLAADESLVDPREADAALASDAVAVCVIKPALLGGLVRSLELASRAQATGRAAVVTHSFDGAVGFAAACELALALPAAPLACGLDPAGVLAPAEAARLPQLGEAFAVRGCDEPGLALRSPA